MAKAKPKEEEADEKDVDAKEKDKDKGKDKGKDKDKDKDKGKDKDKDKGEAGAEGEPKEGEEGAEGEGAPKRSKKKIIIFGVLALIILLAAGGGGWYFFMHKHAEDKPIEEIGPDGKPVAKPVYYTLPEFLVNLNVGGKQSSFLKTTVIIELAKPTDVQWVETNLPRLLDAFNTYLRELRSSDLAGSAGIQRLREELLLRANKALAPIKVNDVLFKEIIVQ